MEKNSEFVFIWKIKNYSSCFQVEGERIRSPSFTVENLCSRSRWFLTLYPRGDSKLADKKCVSCYLSRRTVKNLETVKTLDIDFSLEIVDEDNNMLDIFAEAISVSSLFTKEKSTWGYEEFISYDILAMEMDSWKEDVLTVRCRMLCNDEKKLKISEKEANSIIPVEKHFFEWKVKLPMLLGHFESLDFSISNLYNFEITLFQNMTLFFHLKKCLNDLNRLIKFKITVFNKSGNTVTSKRAEHLFTIAETWKFPDIITKDVLEICKVDSFNCEFKLKGEICTLNGTVLNHSIERLKFITSACVDFIPENSSFSSLQTDIRNLYRNEQYSDVSIKVGSEIFHAHKLILRARSPEFANRVDQIMLENNMDVADLSDEFFEVTMDVFLEFIYKGNVIHLDRHLVSELIIVANKYNTQSLMDECISFLKESLNVGSACKIYAIADSVDCESLKSYVLSFIKSNAVKILTHPDWADWALYNDKLAADILSDLSTALLQKYE